MIDAYKAIMQAADHIEAHPARFDFMASRIPQDLSGVGCAMGWIGYFAGMRSQWCSRVAPLLGFQDVVSTFGMEKFFNRMANLPGRSPWGWSNNGKNCAAALRKYAQIYHAQTVYAPPAPPKRLPYHGIPAAIRAIFKRKRVQHV